MKVQVWKVETIERDVDRYVKRTRYVEAKTKKGAIGNAASLFWVKPKDVRSVVLVPELS